MLRREFLAATAGLTAAVCAPEFARSAEVADASSPESCRRRDELWVVSSRSFGCIDPDDSNRELWQLQRRETSTYWRNAAWHEFAASTQTELPTIVYVHGNRNDWQWAVRNGQTVYQALTRCAENIPPFRFVIYSWPSDQIHGPLKDARFKSAVANNEAYRCGWLLSQLPARARLGLTGFSLGGRILTGALHLLAGGNWVGKTLPAQDRPATRAVLWAPALHNYWLAPNAAHGLALNLLEELKVYFNSCDPVLKRYGMAEQCGNPQALGFSGLASCAALCEAQQRVQQCDASACVGKSHELVAYCAAESIMREARASLFWQAT